MNAVEKYISHYNHLNGKQITKKALVDFHQGLRRVVKNPDAKGHPNYRDLVRMDEVLAGAIAKMANGKMLIECSPVPIKKAPRKPAKPTPSKGPDTGQRGQQIKKNAPGNPVTYPNTTAAQVKRKQSRLPKAELAKLGFVSADQAPKTVQGIIQLPGEIGQFLGQLQRFKGQIVISGETHSSKSELAKQIANAFASIGDEVAYLDWEQGGLESKDTKESMTRNISPENLPLVHVVGDEFPATLDSILSLADKFQVIVLDSGNKLQERTNVWLDQLRIKKPNTFWIVLMQLRDDGKTRGGSSADFNAPTVIQTFRSDQGSHTGNYAYLYKNRGNKTGLYYSMSNKKIIKPSTL